MATEIARTVIRRDRNIVIAGLTAVVALATAYTVYMARQMIAPDPAGHGAAETFSLVGRPMTLGSAPGGQHFLMLFIMWAVMQVAMMSPTAVPMILTYTRFERHRHPQHAPYLSTATFFAGYITVWTLLSAVFALIQTRLHAASVLSPRMASTSSLLGASILIAAGAFQFSPLKRACLNRCRSPVGYLMSEWRNGRAGALVMGMKHGVHCVGCCWLLMALLFVAGVMNLLWMAVITAFVLVEKLAPAGDRFGRLGGVLFIIWGIGVLLW